MKSMKKTGFMSITVLVVVMLISACGNAGSEKGNPGQAAANKNEVTIGEQVWMTRNLGVTTFTNGDEIQEAKTEEEWKSACENGEPAWCYYDNNPENGKKMGVLYNWFAVNDSRGLCPAGWRIANEQDWVELVYAAGGGSSAGIALKSTTDWNNETNADNRTGFTALPSGIRDANGSFSGLYQTAQWWTSTEWIGKKICTYVLEAGADYCTDYPMSNDVALAIRCIKE
jgi:uncharacterized protein (TIGR02145 family)